MEYSMAPVQLLQQLNKTVSSENLQNAAVKEKGIIFDVPGV